MAISMGDIVSAIKLSIMLGAISTLLLLMIGLPLAWWLAQAKGWLADLVNSLVSLPLVLPPTVLGFYLLAFLAPDAPGGHMAQIFGLNSFAFRFEGLLIGAMIFSLPFVVQPLQSAFASIGKQHLEAAATLGANPLDRFFTIILPMGIKGVVLAIIMGFAHAIGEFGVVLMIGGNIEGETRVLSVAIYDAVESLEWQKAHFISFWLLLISFIMILLSVRLQRHPWGAIK